MQEKCRVHEGAADVSQTENSLNNHDQHFSGLGLCKLNAAKGRGQGVGVRNLLFHSSGSQEA